MMSFHKTLKKLKESQVFKDFKEKNKKAFLFSAFFVLTSEFSIETEQLDFYIPEKKKVETFFIDKEVKHKQEDFTPKDKITALNEDIKTDLKELEEIIKKELEKEKLTTYNINKIIVILQKQKEKQIWNITCLLSGFKMLRIQVDCFNSEILESKQGSILDFVQINSK
ncbi:MAG: hypothetical protein IB618_01270 [Candidatus Pacearchaeota archaeon]|nr:MAG: hypothetical protein IB618_01270 [Candidatus Pacearchaeota archaeon]